MSNAATAHPHVVGCDVGKDSVVICDSRTGEIRELANRPEVLADFVGGLPSDCLLVCEATGGWEAVLLDAALAAGIPAHRADGRKIKAFIRSLGRLAKTDRIDSQGITRYGQERADRLERWQAPDPDRQSLQALVRLRRELVDQRAAHKQRLKAPDAAAIRSYLEALIEHLGRAIERIDADINAVAGKTPELRRRIAIAEDIKGCGTVAATGLVALLPELGTLNRRAIAALAGVAPHPIRSGKSDRYRPVRGGRPEVRRLLFMVALSASRCNPELKSFYNRLLTNGKRKIVALTALMRKIVTIINARIRDALPKPSPELS